MFGIIFKHHAVYPVTDKTGGAVAALAGSGFLTEAVVDKTGGAIATFTVDGGSAFEGDRDGRRSLRWINRRRRPRTW